VLTSAAVQPGNDHGSAARLAMLMAFAAPGNLRGLGVATEASTPERGLGHWMSWIPIALLDVMSAPGSIGPLKMYLVNQPLRQPRKPAPFVTGTWG
jgi:hypothetical protein